MRRHGAKTVGAAERRNDAVRPDMADSEAAAPDIRPRSEALTPQRLA